MRNRKRRTARGFWLLIVLSGAAPAYGDAVGDPLLDGWAIATQNLFFNTASVRDPASPDGERECLLAGSHQYRTLWARDFSTSLGGALVSGRQRAARDSLELLLGFQREDGLLPRVVDNLPIARRVILGLAGMSPPFEAPLRAWFTTEYQAITVDQNALVSWAAGEYVARTHDRAFAARWFESASRAVEFLLRDWWADGLLRQPSFSDWQDSIRREGRVAGTNVYFQLALRRLSDWARLLGEEARAERYRVAAENHRRRFEEFFWSEERGHVLNFERDTHLAADANLLAVVYGMLSPEHARRTMRTLRASPLWKPLPGRATWPDYPASMKGSNLTFAGIGDYFDRMHWVWITALAARAERAVGERVSCQRILEDLSRRIARDGTIHEVYDLLKDGKTLAPVRRATYRAEEPFTWSSAMYLEALSEGC